MYRKVLLFILIISIFSCSSHTIKIIKKSNQSKLIVLETWHKVLSGPLDNWKTIYSKELTNGETGTITIKMTFYAKTNYKNLDEELILNIDDTICKLKFQNRKNKVETEQTGSVGAYGIYESWRYLYGEINLSKEFENILNNSKNVEFTIFTDSSPSKIKILEDQLLKLKEFIAISN
ncbi:MAG: hypothetical protein GY754_17030 [bacterium]|nr:hypothetical protein [bacterium]